MIVRIPNNNINEREYVINIILNEFLGIEYSIEVGASHYEIHLDNNKKLVIKDTFFNIYQNNLEYLSLNNIPKRIEDLDIFAASFFMLTRWEEYVNKTRDCHDRFSAVESLAYKQGFLGKPIVNKYIENLKNTLLELDGSLTFKQHQFTQYISCDVDEPFDDTVKNINNLIRVCAGDLLKRQSPLLAIKRVRRYVFNKFENYKYDENYTFDWYMDVCEKEGVTATFYFIPDSREEMNGCYSLEDAAILNLIKHIDSRGHKIGLHGSYQTYKDKKKAKVQKNKLDDVMTSLGINQQIKGNRQHYLRWNSSITPSVLNDAGFEYDTTGSYADRVGFRYGVCYEFSMFDFLNRTRLNIKQRPLIVMECTVIDELYMGLGYTEQTIKIIKGMKRECAKYNGNFSLLWHNDHFRNVRDKGIFKGVLSCL